jgi:DNA repair photolyase
MSDIEVITQDRKGAVLSPSQLPCLGRTPTVNLTAGCAHGCLYCYGRSYAQYPGEGAVVVYTNTLEKLREELRRKRVKPDFVYFSPSSDVFQPIEAVLRLTYAVFALLLSQGIGVAFVTKGSIPPEHFSLLTVHAGLVRAQVGLISHDESVLRVFEPRCAPLEVRLRQIERLVRAGIETEVRIDPILPGVTDDPETFGALFGMLRDVGVRRVALNVLYLRPAMVKSLRDGVADVRLLEQLLNRYTPGVRMRVCDGRFSQTALPRAERESIFSRATKAAHPCGLECHGCGCMNPDLWSESCNLTGTWRRESSLPKQMDLLNDTREKER